MGKTYRQQPSYGDGDRPSRKPSKKINKHPTTNRKSFTQKFAHVDADMVPDERFSKQLNTKPHY